MKFRGFVANADPTTLTSAEVKRFLADLAVRKQMSAAAQNQAFNALLFLFRYVFIKELGDLSGTPRAKQRKYIPTMLSRQEVDLLLAKLREPYAYAIAVGVTGDRHPYRDSLEAVVKFLMPTDSTTVESCSSGSSPRYWRSIFHRLDYGDGH